MLMAAMVMGPLAGLCVEHVSQKNSKARTRVGLQHIHNGFSCICSLKGCNGSKNSMVTAGFEMLINNFSAGIMGMLLAMLGYILIGPIMSGILAILSAGVTFLCGRR